MSSIEEKLEEVLVKTVENDKYIFSAFLALSSGDTRINWSSGVGIAKQEGNIQASSDTPFFIASITKLFTAVTIMKLCEEKKLKLEDKITNYLEEKIVKGIHVYKEIDYTEKITIKHLLSHTSGIADYYEDKPIEGKSYLDMVMEDPDIEVTVDETIQMARENMVPNFIPGTKTKYGDTNFQLLGKIIESIEKKELHEVYLERYFVPLDMRNTWLYTKSKPIDENTKGVAESYYNYRVITDSKPFYAAWADGGLISTTSDSLKFLKALFTGKIISKKTLALMHNWNPIFPPIKYGYGTMYIELPRIFTLFRKLPSLKGHLGSNSTFLLYAEEWDLYLSGALNQFNSPSRSIRFVMKLLLKFKKQLLK